MPDVKVISSTGNAMVSEAFRQAEPDMVCAYPITPQTTIIEGFAKYVADGKVRTEFVTAESEHSAMSVCVGASAAGARVATATSSQGLALMWEELYIAAGMRLPIVLANANRALSAPINIHGDHSDIMGARDAGWIILMAENAQEAYDNTIMAFRIAEDHRVLNPVITALDGFITTHAMERCELIDDESARAFLGDRDPIYPLLDTDTPVSHGMFANLGGTYMELKKAQRTVMDTCMPVIQEVGDEWAKVCGRSYSPVECWGMEDAEYAMVVIGSNAGNARTAAKQLRADGHKVGVVRIRLYRPFPYAEVIDALKNIKAVAILDRADALGAQYGPLGEDVRCALYDLDRRIPTKNYIFGLGGADVPLNILVQAFEDIEKVAAGELDSGLSYLGTR